MNRSHWHTTERYECDELVLSAEANAHFYIEQTFYCYIACMFNMGLLASPIMLIPKR